MRVFLISLLAVFLCSGLARAGDARGDFTVIISGEYYKESGTISPCFPVMAEFVTTNPAVTKVRMQYPFDKNMFMDLSLHSSNHIILQENFMKMNEWSISDFIAMDHMGNEYGSIRLAFQPRAEDEVVTCAALTS